ncbi:type IV pilus assembly protein PilM [Candidatus Uhrbacteria bacterium]|nr:type IV pilus assembly protein PilM [Candidatus Uhrbacteria bacterium]
MSIFKRKQKGYLGIDFGAGGIKVIQLAPEGGRGNLFTYGFTERPPEEIGGDYLESAEIAGGLLKQICARARTSVTHAVSALPIPTVFSAVLSIAAVPKKELLKAVEWEAKKLIPLPLEEVRLDYKELNLKGEKADRGEEQGARGGSAESIAVLLTAAPRSIIDKYLAIAKVAGLNLGSLETEAFALIRALIGKDLSPAVILDMGALRSNILMVDRGIPMFTRSIEIGGKRCTEAIAQSLKVNLGQAEAMKRDVSAPAGAAPPSDIPHILQEVLQPLVNEMKYSFHVYRTRNVIARPPERIILTGGGAQIAGFAEFLSREFNIRAFIGNPWERVNVPPDLAPLLQGFGSRFAVAIGLALRNII